jgi:Helix-turn-helix domain of resolvase
VRQLGRTGGRPPKLTDDDIEAAKAMLANPDIPVTQIAQRLRLSGDALSGGPGDAEARAGGKIVPKPAPPPSTARENARALPLEGQEASGRFLRFARALTVRIQQAMPPGRQRRTALPTKFYLPLSR